MDAEQVGSRTGRMQERMDAEKVGCRTGGMQERRAAKFGSKLAQISALFGRATAIEPFHLRTTATCATFLYFAQMAK